MLVENPLPGIAPWDEIAADPHTWHINFQQSAGTPELLIAGREAAYFQSQFFALGMRDPSRIDAATLQRYACAYRRPSQLAAGLGQYRATPVNAAFNRSHDDATPLPLILVGGERALGPPMATMAAELRRQGWSALTLERVADASHYMLDESADRVAALIRQYAGESR
jgi:pimeloyl-ACP methyl ester carboxylesterase